MRRWLLFVCVALVAALSVGAALAKPDKAVKELIDKRTAESKTWQNSDGSYTLAISAGPIHYKDEAGNWQDINTSFGPPARSGCRCSVTRNPVKVHIGQGSKRKASAARAATASLLPDEITLESEAGSLSFVPDIASPSEPVVDANKLTYINAWPFVDLRYTVRPDGLKEDIVLKQSPSVAQFCCTISHDGLSLDQRPDGSIHFTNADGAECFVIQSAYMYDAVGRQSNAVLLDVESTAGGSTVLRITPDPEWLAQAQYPVVIDPSLFYVKTSDGGAVSYIERTVAPPTVPLGYWHTSSPCRITPYGQDELYSCVAYLRWSLPSIPPANVDYAAITFGQPAGSGSVAMRRLTNCFYTGEWVPVYEYPWVDSSVVLAYGPWGNSLWSTNEINDLVRGWIDGDYTNYGIEVAGTGGQQMTFASVDGTSYPSAWLEVEYSAYVNDSIPPRTPDGVEKTSCTATSVAGTWNVSDDVGTGLWKYQYGIGTAPGLDNIVNWTSNGKSTSFGKSGLTLVSGIDYYISVKAADKAGNWSGIGCSDAFQCPAGTGKIIYVDSILGDNVVNNGTTPTTPKQTITAGLALASAGDRVLVKAGTYNECVTIGPGVGLYGGFSDDWSTRVPKTSTIAGTSTSSNMVYASGSIGAVRVVDGFTITGGTNGVSCSGACMVISNNMITGNRVRGISCGSSSSALITGNEITGNGTSTLSNAAIICWGSYAIITDNTITNNTSRTAYAGVPCGGGVFIDGGGTKTSVISRNTITDNLSLATTGKVGSGIYCGNTDAIITNNTITGNTAASFAGGIYCLGSSSSLKSTIANNIVAGNAATSGGQVVISGIPFDTLYGRGAYLTNNTVVGPASGSPNSCIYCGSSATSPVIRNNILASAAYGVYNYNLGTGNPTGGSNFVASDVTTSYQDAGGIVIGPASGNPLLENDYHLGSNSPCINAGDNSAVGAGWKNVFGGSRIVGPSVDIGADEVWDTTPPEVISVSAPAFATTSPIPVSYTVSDSESGVKTVRLLYKKESGGSWQDSGLTLSSTSASFNFAATENGIYYFDVEAEDNGGNSSSTVGGNGRAHTIFESAPYSVSGRVVVRNDYLYPAGPTMATTVYDESGSQFRKVEYNYGPERELLGTSGSTDSVSCTYDALYRPRSVTDAAGQVTNYVYDDDGDSGTDDPKVGYLSRVEYPGGEVVSYLDHDAYGRPLKRVDAKGVETVYHYDDAEKLLTHVEYPATSALDIFQEYDPVYGRITRTTVGQMSAPAIKTTFSYDDLNGVTGTTTTYAGLSGQTVGYSYWPNGNLMALTTPAGSFSYTYYGDGRPHSLTNPLGETFSWDYFDNGWLGSQSSPVSVTSYLHSPRGQLASLTNATLDQTLLSHYAGTPSMTYDAVGNLLSMTASVPDTATQYSGATTYTYQDTGYQGNQDQLTLESSTRNGGYLNAFAYDSVGNPTTFENVTRQFNAKNQTDAPGFVYDTNGNPTTYNGVPLTFDAENRMTAYGTVLSAGYTASGLRAWKQTASGRTYFLYAGGVPVVELNSAGSVTAVNTFGPTGLLARREGSPVAGTSRFYTFDPHGNVSQTLDSAANVVSTHLYDAFGTSLYGSDALPFGYEGQFGYYMDSETGLQLLGHRYYNPEDGRFINRDPIGYAGGLNLYAYTANNPINSVDPSGYLWYDDLANWVGEKVQTAKDYYNDNLPWQAAGLLNSGIDMVAGAGYYPAAVGHLGEGTGTWWANPSWKTAPGLLNDFVTFSGTLSLTTGAMKTSGRMGSEVGASEEAIVGNGGRSKVYTLTDESGEVRYVGQTTDQAARQAYWKTQQPDLQFNIVAKDLTGIEADGIEQMFIQGYGGASGYSNGGTLINRINNISPKNSYYPTAMDAACSIIFK